MHRLHTILSLLFVISLSLAMVIPAGAKKGETGYQSAFFEWRASDGDFSAWTASAAAPGSDPYPVGGYYGGNYYTGGDFFVSELTSPEISSGFDFKEAIASWNASTPTGTWIEVQARARVGGAWTKWYVLGIWASGTDTIARHSVKLQGDGSGYVAVDTLVLTDKKAAADAVQLKLRLFSEDGLATPAVSYASLALSNTPPKKAPVSAGNPANWNSVLNVPECSQMVYPDGGQVWCSPTSTAMVVKFWANDFGECEPAVRAAVDGVYDWIYDGHGNWPFNTAYAATQSSSGGQPLEASVRRFTSLDEAEPWVKAGIPVIVSFSWGKSELTGAAVPSSNGHLSVLVGFDANGNPIINDPAAATDADVQRTYLRSEWEPLWLQASGGTVYLIYPAGMATP